MQNRVVVTGIGAICCIGKTPDEILSNLQKGKTGIGTAKYIESKHRDTHLFGEVDISNSELIELLQLKADECTRTGLLALFAAKQAIENIPEEDISEYGIISSTTVGGMDRTELELDPAQPPENVEFLQTHRCGDSTNFVAKQLGLQGFSTTISTACSSSANCIMMGARLIEQGVIDKVIVGGADPLSVFAINGFSSLHIYDSQWCKPFDANRQGLNLGEGAAYLVLEREDIANERKARILATVTGYANSNDAYHQTASSPEGDGATLSMSNALAKAGLLPKDIDYVNAHGTGTENNDASELKALERIFGDKIPMYSSTKAFTGHTLAACGALEAFFSILCMNNNAIPPSLNITKALNEEVPPVTSYTEDVKIDHVLSNSFGFGGNNSTIIISRP
ncbi:MAG: beta-ketoacyl-[acyl-carrier-protein] synthase family protein [Bacteroidales bacterium]|nr:beta-ketoacyl-[acyl-carrier-protein] synthase family protein [Bacteroidales bacterium]